MKQLSFSTLFGSPEVRATESVRPFATDAEAKAARDEAYRVAKKQGLNVSRWTLRNQIREYWEMGVPCGDICTVYKLEVY